MWKAVAALFVLVSSVSLGCESIAGIEDRQMAFRSDCYQYCDMLDELCTGTNKVYGSRLACLHTCQLMDPGDALEPRPSNDVVCRIELLKTAGQTGEPRDYCAEAGPAGNGRCGTNCESYCSLLAGACPQDYAAVPDCMAACTAFDDAEEFNYDAQYEQDTLACRLIHVSSSAADPAGHCSHARFRPSSRCLEQEGVTCHDYCRIVAGACRGENAVYESVDQCLAVCAQLEPGVLGQETEDTVGCRIYHSYSALFDPEGHCSHAGPAGDGHCGIDENANCPAYCRLAKAACTDAFDAKYASEAECLADCRSLDGNRPDSGYTIASAETTPFGCRLLHTAQAFADSNQCASALGGGSCGL